MPIPAANSIAAHEPVENSGFSPSSPSGMRPARLKAKTKRKMSRPAAITVKIQPRFCIVHVSMTPETLFTTSG